MSSSSSSKGLSDSGSNHPSRSLNTSGNPKNLGTSFVPIVIPISLHPEGKVVLTYLKEPTKYKEHIIIKIASEFGVIPLCDIRASELTEAILDAHREREHFLGMPLRLGLGGQYTFLNPFSNFLLYMPEPIGL